MCDESKTHAERAQWLVSQLTLAEKIPLLRNTASAVPRMGIPLYEWWNEALHGIGQSHGVHYGPTTPYATSFPQVVTTGASFNKSLFHQIGSTIGDEGRAFANVGHAGLTFWAPNINIVRDPRWGRGQETPGEDPYLTATYAETFVPGVQGDDPKYLKASSCCKHYYAYDMEKWGGTDRHHFDANITLQDEADTYFPAFHSCVRNGKASGMMCSYNAVNGVPSCANSRIMNGFARSSWGFEGYITSDCNAVKNIVDDHHYATPNEVVRDTLSAGMDNDCGEFLQGNTNNSVVAGVTNMSTIDTALVRLFTLHLRLGYYDKESEQKYTTYTYKEKANTPANQKLALDAAQQGMVLLKNTASALPLSSASKVALLGPNANATTVMQGNYYGQAPYLVSPLMGLSSYATTTMQAGCADCACTSDKDFPAAVAAAKEADATVMVMGISGQQEGEGNDRTSIAFPPLQLELVKQVTDVAKGPVVVVVMGGGSLDMTALKENPKVSAIVWAGYPGQSGGQAIADVLFGAVNPSGRLTHTQYPEEYIANLSMLDMGMRPNATNNNTGRTYRFYTGTPVYSFGEGLSYTNFSYEVSQGGAVAASAVAAECTKNNARKAYSVMPDDKTLATLTVTVKNTGSIRGATVPMVFMKPPAAEGAPIKFLVGFERVTLEPGQQTEVAFPLYYSAFSVANAMGEHEVLKGTWNVGVNFDDAATSSFTVA